MDSLLWVSYFPELFLIQTSLHSHHLPPIEKLKIICLYQIFAFTYYLHMSSFCQVLTLFPPALPTLRRGIQKKRKVGHAELERKDK